MYKSYGKTVFSKNVRRTLQVNRDKLTTPGPGNYRMQSDFGIYNPNDIHGWTQSRIYVDKKGHKIYDSD